jgi:hypothetical protein
VLHDHAKITSTTLLRRCRSLFETADRLLKGAGIDLFLVGRKVDSNRRALADLQLRLEVLGQSLTLTLGPLVRIIAAAGASRCHPRAARMSFLFAPVRKASMNGKNDIRRTPDLIRSHAHLRTLMALQSRETAGSTLGLLFSSSSPSTSHRGVAVRLLI